MRRFSHQLGLAGAASLALPAIGLLALAAPCFGQDNSIIEAAFGNTILSTYPDGRTARLWLEPDGTYAGEGRSHDRTSGHWRLKGGSLCFRQSRPIAFPFSYCTPLGPVRVDASWPARAVTGERLNVQLVSGRSETSGG